MKECDMMAGCRDTVVRLDNGFEEVRYDFEQLGYRELCDV